MDLPAQGNALQGAMAAPQAGPGSGAGGTGAPANPLMAGAPVSAAPAPTHDMTASTLHHLSEMRRHFMDLLKNPGVGKQDMKGPMLDALADLMSEGLLDSKKSVAMIQMFPEGPDQQKQWLENSLQMLGAAQAKILEDHRMSHQGTGIYAEEVKHHKRGGGHLDTIASVMDHYKPKGRGRA